MSLAELEDAATVCALVSEAYDAFEHLNELEAYPSARDADEEEIAEATFKASRAEVELKKFLDYVDGPRRRFSIAGTERDE